MSHMTTIEMEIKDLACVKSACKYLGYRVEENATVQLFQRDARFTGCTAVHMPGWKYPAAIADSKLHYDNYEGDWGDIKHLNAFRQRYARDVAVKEARRKGFRVEETVDNNGKIKLRLSR